MKFARWIFGASLAAAVSAPMNAVAQTCMTDGQPGNAVGVLSIASVRDAAGRPQRPYIVTLSAPACFTASDPEDSVKSTRKVHIYSTNEKIHATIAAFVGKRVAVRGNPFPAHTAHHHAPIVIDITEIRQR